MGKRGDFIYNIRANRVTKYYKVDKQVLAENVQTKSIENLSRGEYIGTVSQKNKKRIYDIVTYWHVCTQHWKASYQDKKQRQLAFLTLTLPYEQMHTDNELKRGALNSFLVVQQRKMNGDPYLWKAEKQKNGNLHFHLIVDITFGEMDYRTEWNKCIDKMGYIDYYRMKNEAFHNGGFKVRTDLLGKYSELEQMGWYLKGKNDNWANPRTTHVELLKGGGQIAEYIGKYVGKNESDQLVDGRVWGCSDVLRGVERFEFAETDYQKSTVQKYLVAAAGVHVVNDFCEVYSMASAFYKLPKNSSLYRRFHQHMLDTYNGIYGVYFGKRAFNNFL